MVSLILIGKSDSGKSSTGNSIIGNDVFTVNSSAMGLAKKSTPVKQEGDWEGGRKVTVIDGLDVCYCGENADFSDVENALRLSGTGINAFLIVVKYGDIFTQVEQKVVEMTKTIFGNDVIKKFGILVFTHVDDFKRDSADEDNKLKTFEDWIEEQTGEIKDLYSESRKRFVLFDNQTQEVKARKNQVHKLNQIVHSIKNEMKTLYSFDDYNAAANDRNILQLKKLSFQRGSECVDFIKEIDTKIESVEGDNNFQDLEEIIKKLQQYANKITLEFGENLHISEEIIKKIKLVLAEVKCKVSELQEKKFSQVTLKPSSIHSSNQFEALTQSEPDKNDTYFKKGLTAKRQRSLSDEEIDVVQTDDLFLEDTLNNYFSEVEKNEDRLIATYHKILQCTDLDEKTEHEITLKLKFYEHHKNINGPKNPRLMDVSDEEIEADEDKSNKRKRTVNDETDFNGWRSHCFLSY